ncbi:HD domain-containing protein [Thiofilum flexile]|uniref:HD domain-containing protein n=1 Tax=Thiofilum flexile TaxID=125627 RepID=UPI0003725746|nr:HD domain-containing protein [Thiofilum flexile]
MKKQDIAGILEFLRGAEQLKNTLRSGNTSNGRRESTAEHTWRLCLMILLFEDEYPEIDILKLMKICIIHDLGEAISGDIPAVDQIAGSNKALEERKDLEQLLQPLRSDLQEKILQLWDEYEQATSPEARLAKAFDKLETVLQHTQGQNPPDFDYAFNLAYGKKYTDHDALTTQIRAMIDKDTQALAENSPSV